LNNYYYENCYKIIKQQITSKEKTIVFMESKTEIEVFRLMPEEGKNYMTAVFTRKEGKYPTEKYYTTNSLVYVGTCVSTVRYGFGDGSSGSSFFSNNGKDVKVDYTYDGTTCFVEVK